jgi:hypothetical protein
MTLIYDVFFFFLTNFLFDSNFELKNFNNSLKKLLLGDGGNHLVQVCYNDGNIGTCSNIGNFVLTWQHYTNIMFSRYYNGIVQA